MEQRNYKGDEPPDLAVKNSGRVEVQQGGEGAAAELVQEKDGHGAGDDEVHQVGDAEFWVPVREAVQPAVHGAHVGASFKDVGFVR